VPEYDESQHPRDDQGRWSEREHWSDQAFEENQRDISDYRNRRKASIWDADGHQPYDQDEEDQREDERRKEEEERNRASRSQGWFGDRTQDQFGSPWRAPSQGGDNPWRNSVYGLYRPRGGSNRYVDPYHRRKATYTRRFNRLPPSKKYRQYRSWYRRTKQKGRAMKRRDWI
jgi:hypothetical protein